MPKSFLLPGTRPQQAVFLLALEALEAEGRGAVEEEESQGWRVVEVGHLKRLVTVVVEETADPQPPELEEAEAAQRRRLSADEAEDRADMDRSHLFGVVQHVVSPHSSFVGCEEFGSLTSTWEAEEGLEDEESACRKRVETCEGNSRMAIALREAREALKRGREADLAAMSALSQAAMRQQRCAAATLAALTDRLLLTRCFARLLLRRRQGRRCVPSPPPSPSSSTFSSSSGADTIWRTLYPSWPGQQRNPPDVPRMSLREVELEAELACFRSRVPVVESLERFCVDALEGCGRQEVEKEWECTVLRGVALHRFSAFEEHPTRQQLVLLERLAFSRLLYNFHFTALASGVRVQESLHQQPSSQLLLDCFRLSADNDRLAADNFMLRQLLFAKSSRCVDLSDPVLPPMTSSLF